ncbi:prepilin-type N-terminal cleavage/methylation domain-containing protein [Colwellia sp. D2M02]|uniref:PilW family protein n=1 Tax=Colwellia sp. D2M02 TaxID=2841562 RepID=UPI001C087C10|nr:prepilin-type N-terminal cleavage/methylation domain-containing protein [Colwellia sp. D2M02]MBU2891944.1 prepilin-type N-terminal cleavage/methylation domain-containing protein [Colwellia sp. D2M02]
MKKKHQSGFTLIELMIASSLLMLVMYAGYFAYSLYSNSWKKQSYAFWQATDKGVNLTSLTRVIEATHPYIVDNINDNSSLYFIATPHHIRFVSKSPIFADEAAVVELQLVGSSLVYRESTLLKAPLFNQHEQREWQHSIVLLNYLTAARFEFFGWDNLEQLQHYELQRDNLLHDEAPIEPQWYNQHQMEERQLLPLSISLTYSVKGGQELSIPFQLPQQTQHALYRYIGIQV